MKHKYEFVVQEHYQHGGLGLRPKHRIDFEPLGGLGVAHDVFEHYFKTDRNDVGHELMAVGHAFFIRNTRDVLIGFQGVLEGIWSYYKNYLNKPPIILDLPCRPRPLKGDHEYIEEAIHKLLPLMFEHNDRGDDAEYDDIWYNHYTFEVERLKKEAVYWVRLGYNKAVKLYGDRSDSVHYAFEKLEQEANRFLSGALEYDEFHVTVDYKNPSNFMIECGEDLWDKNDF